MQRRVCCTSTLQGVHTVHSVKGDFEQMDFQGATVLRYQEVIDSVASRARPAFNEEGIDE